MSFICFFLLFIIFHFHSFVVGQSISHLFPICDILQIYWECNQREITGGQLQAWKGRGEINLISHFHHFLFIFTPPLIPHYPHCVSPYRMFPLSQPSVTLSYKISLSFSILHFLSQGFLSRIKSISSVLKRR